jgi:hypothetical protein
MRVYIGDVTALGIFCFKEACICDSGVQEFGPPDWGSGETGTQGEGFVLMPHGLVVAEDDDENMQELPEDLN